MIENQTGLPMVMKQYGTADPALDAPDPGRFARVLPPGSRWGARAGCAAAGAPAPSGGRDPGAKTRR